MHWIKTLRKIHRSLYLGIPKDFADSIGIGPGSKIELFLDGDSLLLRKVEQ